MTLKQRIDTALTDADYDVRQWPNRGKGSVEARFSGFVPFNNRLVPRVDVVMYVLGIDAEDEATGLLQVLSDVDDCFPSLESVAVSYVDRNSQNTNRRYTMITVRCRGA